MQKKKTQCKQNKYFIKIEETKTHKKKRLTNEAITN